MIKLRNIAKCYRSGAGMTYVLQQINIDIAEGEFVTIMGPSGAGKTTLLNILGMLDSDWEGEFHLFDQAVHDLKPKQRMALNKQYIGFVFQNFNLLDTLTVYENLDIPLSYRNVKGAERAGIVCDTLDRFGIVGKKNLYPSQLSGDSSNWLASPARWSPIPSSSWPMNRRATCTRHRARRSWICSRSSIERARPLSRSRIRTSTPRTATASSTSKTAGWTVIPLSLRRRPGSSDR